MTNIEYSIIVLVLATLCLLAMLYYIIVDVKQIYRRFRQLQENISRGNMLVIKPHTIHLLILYIAYVWLFALSACLSGKGNVGMQAVPMAVQFLRNALLQGLRSMGLAAGIAVDAVVAFQLNRK